MFAFFSFPVYKCHLLKNKRHLRIKQNFDLFQHILLKTVKN